MAKTTRAYPITEAEARRAIGEAEQRWGRNKAAGDLAYRNARVKPADGLVAFSFAESPRTPGAYKRIPFA